MASSQDFLIRARNIGLQREGRQILLDVHVSVGPGEIVTLIGPNGAGKTTLVRVLLGLERADCGDLERREGLRFGYVPQRFAMDQSMPLTVARFLTLGRRAAPARVAGVLDEVGAGLLAQVQMAHLSGGQMQRVLLARALIGQPDLLVLDEPVQGVDFKGEAAFYALIARLRDDHGMGILMVSHDLHVVFSGSDRVICLNQHVCCSGGPEKVARDPEYIKLFGKEHAEAFGVYRHHHDHTHGLAGEIEPKDTAPDK